MLFAKSNKRSQTTVRRLLIQETIKLIIYLYDVLKACPKTSPRKITKKPSLINDKRNEVEDFQENGYRNSEIGQQLKTHDLDIIEIEKYSQHDEVNNRINKNFKNYNSFNPFEQAPDDKISIAVYDNPSSYGDFFSVFDTEYRYPESFNTNSDIYTTREPCTDASSCIESSPSLIDYESIFDMGTQSYSYETDFDANILSTFTSYANNQDQHILNGNDFENDVRIFNFELESNY